MSEQTDNLVSLLKPFGLSQEESEIYLILLEKGSLSALSISRSIHMARTKVYRLLDKLIDRQLVAQQTHTSGFKFIANHPSQLEISLNQQQQSLSGLSQSLPQLIKTLEKITIPSHPGSQVFYYQGPKGLSQVNWNLINAKKGFLSYEVAIADAYIPQPEAEQLRTELFKKRHIDCRTITNLTKIAPFTNVSQLVKHWSISHLPKKVLDVTSDIFIYNDIYTVCNYLDKGDIFCFEVKNQKLADLHKQIFENLWSQAKPLKIIDQHGHAKL